MQQSLARITFVVEDYDEAILFFTQKLGFELMEDTHLEQDKRWVVRLRCSRICTAISGPGTE